MDTERRRLCLRLLAQAQDGDVTAREVLTREVADEFKGMVSYLYLDDPAFDRDDLTQAFRDGIYRAIAVVDGRGDPLYHLAWRGRGSCLSLITRTNRRRHGASGETAVTSMEAIWEAAPDWEPWAVEVHEPDEDVPGVRLIREEERAEAHRRLEVLLDSVQLVGRDHDVLEWLLDPKHDIDRLGANQELAAHLGVTEQRASQLRTRIYRKIREAAACPGP